MQHESCNSNGVQPYSFPEKVDTFPKPADFTAKVDSISFLEPVNLEFCNFHFSIKCCFFKQYSAKDNGKVLQTD